MGSSLGLISVGGTGDPLAGLLEGAGLDLGLFLTEGRGVTDILDAVSLSESLSNGMGEPRRELSLKNSLHGAFITYYKRN